MDEVIKNSLLIVDDENINLKILTHILGQEYTIYTAVNGSGAIERAKEYKPDLILLDILMPGMDGYETLSRIKNDEEIKHIPVVFITGLSSALDEEKGLSLNAADYITKPFSAMIVKFRVRNQIQIVNQMREIERLSMTDQLTALPNRRCFDGRINMEWKLAKREKTPISLLMVDIDHFKSINDTYGHQHGDVVLQKIAAEYPLSFNRPADFAARWGGEEFTALLPNTPMEGAVEVAEKIRKSIETLVIPCAENPDFRVTVSVGVNCVIPEQDSSLHNFISGADKALYAAKDAGRNKVLAFDNFN
jgi:diguanylate cyclase (GGDEF)-like protein